MENEPIKPYNKNNIVFSKTLLRNVVIGLLVLIFGFLVFTYLNSGLSKEQAEKEFKKYWKENIVNNLEENQLKNTEIENISKIRSHTYSVKVHYIQEVKYRVPDFFTYDDYLKERKLYDEYLKEHGRTEEDYPIEEYLKDIYPADEMKEKKVSTWKWENKIEEHTIELVYKKWDTGWFVEEKRK